MIPALKNAEFIRYGVMHRNTFINSTVLLNKNFSIKGKEKTFFIGQITGVEGYVESATTGLIAGIYLERIINGKSEILVPDDTVNGALIRYITTENKDFEPMNANFGILPPLSMIVKDKAKKKQMQAERAIEKIKQFKQEIDI
jgi:methylenetetrahydrofolate--tRNA-(uracil-5-)-methyltransferase